MGQDTKIEWTDHTWNPWVGCTRVSPGCDHCYMFDGMTRFGRDPEVVTRTAPATFNKPRTWNRRAPAGAPKRGAGVDGKWEGAPLVFTCSWGDWFHADADEHRADAWAMVRECDRLIFQILTKRHGRIGAHLPPDWADGYDNVWLGATVENDEQAVRRVRVLAEIPAAVRFLSYEPALGRVLWDDVLSVADPLTGEPAIDWLIIGGESGPKARPFDVEWARSAVEACRRHGVAPFVKQLGSRPMLDDPRAELVDKKGGDWSEWPADLRVREWPS